MGLRRDQTRTAKPVESWPSMCAALESGDIKGLEIIGYRACAKSTTASLALVLWAALEHPDKYPFIVMLADTRGQASINAASVQHELRISPEDQWLARGQFGQGAANFEVMRGWTGEWCIARPWSFSPSG